MAGIMRQDLYRELFEVEDHHWWHKQKRLMVHSLIERNCRQPGRVLDLGAGSGKLLDELKQKGWQVAGVDADEKAVRLARRRGLKLVKLNQNQIRLPFTDNNFDLVVSLDTLEHVKTDAAAIGEMKRVVKPEGLILITVPANPWLFSYWDKMLGHFRRYSKTSLARLIKTAGLRPVFVSFFFSYLLLPVSLIRWFRNRLKLTAVSDFQLTPVNFLVAPLMAFLGFLERQVVKFTPLPFGLSLICLIKKK